jgi:hypothetical protein
MAEKEITGRKRISGVGGTIGGNEIGMTIGGPPEPHKPTSSIWTISRREVGGAKPLEGVKRRKSRRGGTAVIVG